MITALREYLLQTSTHPAAQPLLQFSDGKYLPPLFSHSQFAGFGNIICGFDSKQYTSNSFRIRAATTEEAEGLTD